MITINQNQEASITNLLSKANVKSEDVKINTNHEGLVHVGFVSENKNLLKFTVFKCGTIKPGVFGKEGGN